MQRALQRGARSAQHSDTQNDPWTYTDTCWTIVLDINTTHAHTHTHTHTHSLTHTHTHTPRDFCVNLCGESSCAVVGWHYLSNATCLIRPRLLYALCSFKEHHTLLHHSPLLKNTCIWQVALDKWFPLSFGSMARREHIRGNTSIRHIMLIVVLILCCCLAIDINS